MEEKENLIKKYFSLGLHQKEILIFLSMIHNIDMHPRTLKRILKKLQLYRRKQYSKIEDIAKFIENEIGKSGQMHGYRWMHLRCLQHGFTVTQDVVRELIAIYDSEGVDIRKRKRLRRRQYYNSGPNFLWHIDAYDKLKPYGICISGCIDGYSRHIIWLEAARTSSDPKVIGGYFVNAVKSLRACPATIRSDMGTENKTVEKIQRALCDLLRSEDSHKPPYLYGKSSANQRIESWWSILRKQNAQYWMNIFEMLKNEGHFNGTFLDKSLIQFCFLDIIQNELNDVVLEWNVHKIRKTRNCNVPAGRPIIMFELPELYDARDFKIEVPEIVIQPLEEECKFFHTPCDEDVFALCKDIVSEKNYTTSTNPYDTIQLYINLRNDICTLLNI